MISYKMMAMILRTIVVIGKIILRGDKIISTRARES
jgi:hypothetical protein